MSYEEHGCSSREEYLQMLALDKGVDEEIVEALGGALGEEEDFDGLLSFLDDMEYASAVRGAEEEDSKEDELEESGNLMSISLIIGRDLNDTDWED